MPGNDLHELMEQADALRMMKPEGSYEWFDDMIPKAKKLLQQIQREQAVYSDCMTTETFNKARNCCDTLENWIRQLQQTRNLLEKQKSTILKSEMNRRSIHDGAYNMFRGFLGN
ncbi:hypothetical protein BLA29_008460 [Euroglyphus maynei]|uniref:Uncharacterized protein n=1 Tax=Euroglyphus maynei TaxID=6958 RepID=A0A1Y3BCB7_EURMA|nr:hypothetical protein BLA29_008460 [Euroglyphus maynei]